MLFSHKMSRLALATCFAMGVALPASAADTASDIRGQITGPAGNAVSDAKVTIIHQPTGTVIMSGHKSLKNYENKLIF